MTLTWGMHCSIVRTTAIANSDSQILNVCWALSYYDLPQISSTNVPGLYRSYFRGMGTRKRARIKVLSQKKKKGKKMSHTNRNLNSANRILRPLGFQTFQNISCGINFISFVVISDSIKIQNRSISLFSISRLFFFVT